jgi:predicted lipoprotein with Yx(FWY)xxD motif
MSQNLFASNLNFIVTLLIVNCHALCYGFFSLMSGSHTFCQGATALADALKVNTSVTIIYLHVNGIDESIRATVRELIDRNKRLWHLFLYDARRMLLSVMCADECGVVWPYLLGRGNITDGIAAPDDIDALRATHDSIVVERLRHLFLFDARRMLLSLMCTDECGVVWPYLLENRNITDGVAAPDDIDALRATFAAIVAARQIQQ